MHTNFLWENLLEDEVDGRITFWRRKVVMMEGGYYRLRIVFCGKRLVLAMLNHLVLLPEI